MADGESPTLYARGERLGTWGAELKSAIPEHLEREAGNALLTVSGWSELRGENRGGRDARTRLCDVYLSCQV
jgi:hypothetical protein